MPINRIINRAIEANAIINDKFANNSITVAKIPDGSITLNKLANTAISSISSLRIITIQTPSGTGFTDLNTTETITITGSGFQSGVKIFFDEIEITQANINYVDSTTVTFPAPALVPDIYHLWMFNPDGGSTVKPLGIQYVSPPIWETFSVPSASQYNYYSATVSAISQETLSYSLVGVLPTGISLSPKGKISGYPIAAVGSYFIGITTKTASGIENTRYFTFDLSAGSFIANVDVLTVAGGGGGAMGGGGAGGFRIASNLTVSSTGNVSVIVGGGGGFSYQNSFNILNQPGYNSQIRGGYGSNSSFSANGVVLSQSSGGGGGGAGFGVNAWANSGGSGGGGGVSAGAAFLNTGLVQNGSGGSGNTGNYTPAEGYAGGDGGYNTSLTAANFNQSFSGLSFQKAGGGGGGAGGPGSTVVSAAASPTGGAGGPAIYSTFTGANVAYAGGGGGGGGIAGGAGGGAGAGSGPGNGGTDSASGGDAAPNTGSGGGGMKYGQPMNSNDTPTGTVTVRSGTGGSGIVIAKLYPTFGFFTGGNLLNQTGGVSVYEFKTSNVFIISNSVVAGTTVSWMPTTTSITVIRGLNYYQTVSAQSQVAVFYELYSGNLPEGIQLNGRTGELLGTISGNAVTSIFDLRAVNVFGQVSPLLTITINVQTVLTVDYLAIGGGGGSGSAGGNFGGGGGAGGVISVSSVSINAGLSLPIVIGSGGAVNASGGDTSLRTSEVTTVTAFGGGAGGQPGTNVSLNGLAGANGGSGGGGGGQFVLGGGGLVGSGGLGTSGQGFNGGAGTTRTGSGVAASGGGGGAARVGFDAVFGGTAGNGGAGGFATGSYSSWATDTSTGVGGSYAGGGGGGFGIFNGGGNGVSGAAGGGGAGTAGGANAEANTGSGGNQGGSGLVLIRYSGTPLGIGGNVQIVSGYTYHIFRTSGNLFVGSTGPIWLSPDSASVPNNMVNGSSYTITFVGDGIYKPLTYTLIAGSLPPGLSLNSSTGVLSGTISTAAPAVYDITIRISDTINIFNDRTFRLGINGALRVDIEILAIGGGGGNGAKDNSWGGGAAGGGGGGAYNTASIYPGASMLVYVGGGGLCNGGESRGFSNPGGANGGGTGGASGLTGASGAGGGGGGWSGVYYNNSYLVVAGGGGGGGGGGEGSADDFVGLPGGVQPNGTSGSMTGGTGQSFGGGDGGSAGGGGGGYEGGIGGAISGPGANGGTNFGSLTYPGSGTSSAAIPSNIATDFNYTNQSYGNAGGYISSGSPGIVIIQYSGTQQKLSGGVVNISGGKVRHVFTTTGSNSITY